MDRHYRKIEETLDQILAPLKIRVLYDHCRPKQYGHSKFLEWLTSYIVLICASLMSLRLGVGLPPGYSVHPDMGLEWSYFGDQESKQFLARIREFIASNNISRSEVQGSSDWHTDFKAVEDRRS